MLAGMKAYSLDLRQKILRACDQRLGSQHAIAILFGVSLSFVEQGLRPTLRAGDIVIMANLRAHKAAGIREASERTGAQLLYLPPYSPELSPIEPCWSKLKTALRTAKARTREALEQAIAQALATITVSDAHSWFHHCGYALH
jgi:hypothetical protein